MDSELDIGSFPVVGTEERVSRYLEPKLSKCITCLTEYLLSATTVFLYTGYTLSQAFFFFFFGFNRTTTHATELDSWVTLDDVGRVVYGAHYA